MLELLCMLILVARCVLLLFPNLRWHVDSGGLHLNGIQKISSRRLQGRILLSVPGFVFSMALLQSSHHRRDQLIIRCCKRGWQLRLLDWRRHHLAQSGVNVRHSLPPGSYMDNLRFIALQSYQDPNQLPLPQHLRHLCIHVGKVLHSTSGSFHLHQSVQKAEEQQVQAIAGESHPNIKHIQRKYAENKPQTERIEIVIRWCRPDLWFGC